MAEHEPAIRRLCIATAAGVPGPLTRLRESAGFYRLCLVTDPVEGVELACVPPGFDEVSLVADLMVAMHKEIITTHGFGRPVLAGFHVGITRVVGDGLGGKGAERVIALIRHPALRAVYAGNGPPGPLAVAFTAALFEELHAEGLPDHGWEPVPAADAWLKWFGPAHDAGI